MKKTARLLATMVLAFCVLPGCRMNMDDIARAFSTADKHIDSFGKASEELTPEQEHYLGRAVAARIIQKHPVLKDAKANRYLNQIGQALALYSEQPFTYGGYHFVLLDSGEVNAFAAPDGLIFVTRGMAALVSGESELAAVLAHEIAHVQNKDAVKAIKASRMTDALLLLGKDSASRYGSGLPGARLLDLFSGSVDDIVTTLVNRGYSRSQEYAADSGAKKILALAGYNPEALDDVLRVMEQRAPANGSGFGATHPSATDRLAAVKSAGATSDEGQGKEARSRRFRTAFSALGDSSR